MLSIRALVLAAATVAAIATPSAADTRIFIIDRFDGDGVDACLSSGAPCGERTAAAWCKAHNYDRAIDFGRIAEPPLAPASVAAPRAACTGPLCPAAVAITCSR